MLKRIAASLMLCGASIAVMAAPSDRTDRIEVSKSAIVAIAENNQNEIWDLLSPQLKNKLIQQHGNEAQARLAISNHFAIMPAMMAKGSGMPIEMVNKFIQAAMRGDINTIWNLYPPQYRQALIQRYGSEAAVKAALPKELPTMQKNLIVPLKNSINQINGQWYITAPINYSRTQTGSITVNHSSARAAAMTYAMAFAEDDVEAMWQIVSPEVKNAMIQKHGSAAAAQAHMIMQQREVMQFDNQQHKEAFINLLAERMLEKSVQYSDGKWYIHLNSFFDVNL